MQNFKLGLKRDENWAIDKISNLISTKNGLVHSAFVSLNPNLEKEYDSIVDIVWKVGHYKVIEEFRRRLKSDKKLVNPFRVFLADATKFYLYWIKAWAKAYTLTRVSDIVVSRLDVYDSDSYDPEFNLPFMTLSPKVQDKVSRTIHRCLIYLGDLARYRESHVPSNGKREKRWSLARNFYTLAIWLFPENGNPYNQLAVIESYEGNEMGALDYYFKSLSVTVPFSTGFDNIVVLLKKITAREQVKESMVEVGHYLILMHSSLLIDKSIQKYQEEKILFIKGLYSDLQKGNFPSIRYIKTIWSHSALQSLGGVEGLQRQYVLWETCFEIIIMILQYVLDGQQKLDICFSALKLFQRFIFSHTDNEALVNSFKENVSTLMVRFFNRFCMEYSHLMQESLKLEILREDVENIGWILFLNDPMASFWSLDKLNENPVDEVKVRQAQILFLGLKFEDFPMLGIRVDRSNVVPVFSAQKSSEQENITPESMREDMAIHPVLNSILDTMDGQDSEEDQEILVYKGRKQDSTPKSSNPLNFWSSSFKSESLVKDSKPYSGTPMSGYAKAAVNNEMMQDPPSDGVNTMSFLGLVSSPLAYRHPHPSSTPIHPGIPRQTFSMPPLQQTPTEFVGAPVNQMGQSHHSTAQPPAGFSIPAPPGFTKFGQPSQNSSHSSNGLESPWSKQISSSSFINPEVAASPASMPPGIGGESYYQPPTNNSLSPWLNAGAFGGIGSETVTHTANAFVYNRAPSESSPAWLNQPHQNPAANFSNSDNGKQKIFNPAVQSFTHW